MRNLEKVFDKRDDDPELVSADETIEHASPPHLRHRVRMVRWRRCEKQFYWKRWSSCSTARGMLSNEALLALSGLENKLATKM